VDGKWSARDCVLRSNGKLKGAERLCGFKTVPIEPGHYWIKLINGGQEIALGELNPLRKKKVVFYFPNTELAHDGDLGDLIVKDGGRFWSERIVPPDIQPAAGLPDH
jgi:hypothetical protein